MISKFFIERPVLANVLAVLMIVIGAVALLSLPVAQYPNVVPPTIQVTTRYPGASARTVVDTVALPIEQQVNGVDGMIYMQSYSASDGSYVLTVTFKIGMDINFAQILVQNRVSSALAALPQPVQAQGVTVQQRSTAVLMFVTLSSPDSRYDSLYLANYATINLKDQLARLPGVGNVNVFGAGQYSMRVWLDPNQLQARSLTTQDVINALKGQNQQVAAGQLGMPPAPDAQSFQFTLDIAGRLDEAAQFEDIVVKTASDGQDDPSARRRPGRARRPDLLAGIHAQWQAGGRHGHLSDARGQRADGGGRGQGAGWPRSPRPFRRGSSTPSRSIPRPSCAPRSRRSTRPCSRRRSWC